MPRVLSTIINSVAKFVENLYNHSAVDVCYNFFNKSIFEILFLFFLSLSLLKKFWFYFLLCLAGAGIVVVVVVVNIPCINCLLCTFTKSSHGVLPLLYYFYKAIYQWRIRCYICTLTL